MRKKLNLFVDIRSKGQKVQFKPLENLFTDFVLIFLLKIGLSRRQRLFCRGALIFIFFLFTIYSFIILKKQRMKSDRICVTSALLERGLYSHGGCFFFKSFNFDLFCGREIA